jgi:hypothetical protein
MYRSGGGRIHARDAVECRAFARAIRPDEAKNLALLDIERDVRYGSEAVEHLRQAGDGEEGHRRFADSQEGKGARFAGPS